MTLYECTGCGRRFLMVRGGTCTHCGSRLQNLAVPRD